MNTYVLVLAFFSFLLGCQGNNDEKFIEWFKAKGGVPTGVSLANFPDMGRGVVAIQNINENDHILFIPNKILLSRELMLTSTDPIHKKIAETFPSSDQAVIAVLLLEYERRSESEWKPYLDVLPKYVPNLSHFSVSSLNQLQNAQLKQDALENQQTITTNYAQFINKATPFWPMDMVISLEEYKWAASIIDSRGLRFKGQVVLAPFADMFNYQSNHITRDANSGSFFLQHHIIGSAGLAITADRKGVKGKQLFEDYGDNMDMIYITYHGFVPAHNPFRCVMLQLPNMLSLNKRARELVTALQFKKPPSKCLAYPVTPASTGKKAKGAGVFNSGVLAYFTAMAMTAAEHTACTASIQSNDMNSNKYWSIVFDACGFDRVTNTVNTVMELHQNHTAAGAAAAGSLSLTMDSLEVRAMRLIYEYMLHQMLEITYPSTLSEMELELAMQASIQTDEQLLQAIPAMMAADMSNYTIPHLAMAYQYRVYRKQLWKQLIQLFNISTYISTSSTPSIEKDQETGAGVEVGVSGDAVISADTTAVQSTETTTSSTTLSPLSVQLQAFNDWVRAAAPQVMHIEAVELPLPYRVGTVATQDITAEEVYLSIPTSIIIDNHKANTDVVFSKLIQQLQERYKSSDEFHELLLYILYHKYILGATSYYYPYLRLLPTIHQLGSPILWTEELIQDRLTPSVIVDVALEERRRIYKTFELVSQIDLIHAFFSNFSTPAEVFTLENYLWANSILNSRSIWWEGKRHLVPLLDFINCEEGPVTSRVHATALDVSKQYAVTHAGWDVKQGEQLFENYGQPNHIYYLYHGFMLTSNTHDCIYTHLVLNKTELESIDWKIAKPIATRLGIRPGQQKVTIPTCLKEAIPETVWLYLSLKMNTYTELFKERKIGMITLPAATYLLDIVKERLVAYARISTSHTPSTQFLNSEVVVLNKVKQYLTNYVNTN